MNKAAIFKLLEKHGFDDPSINLAQYIKLMKKKQKTFDHYT